MKIKVWKPEGGYFLLGIMFATRNGRQWRTRYVFIGGQKLLGFLGGDHENATHAYRTHPTRAPVSPSSKPEKNSGAGRCRDPRLTAPATG
jgi:hypothetical protein